MRLETTMNLDDAIAAHAEWKTKLRRAIQKKEPLDVASISSDNKCPLGQWLHGEARGQYARLTSYGTCVANHAEFHRCAGKVATKINAGNYTEAEAMLANGTPYAAASSAVGVAIIGLRKEANL
jgi:methyl-accepting chemotaxis protein